MASFRFTTRNARHCAVVLFIVLSTITSITQLSTYLSFDGIRLPHNHRLLYTEFKEGFYNTFPATLDGFDEGLVVSLPSNSSNTPMLVDRQRTLWTAGWNARHTQYFEDAPSLITWTQDAEMIFERAYRRLHFARDCASVNG